MLSVDRSRFETTARGLFAATCARLGLRMRLAVCLAITFTGLAAVAPASHADNCSYSLITCNYLQTQTLVLPMRNQVMSAVIKPYHTAQARALYRQLLPAGYAVPGTPLIGVYFTSVNIPTQTGTPLDPIADADHYNEGSISLLTEHDGELGWFHLGMPMDSPGAQSLGYPIGYPKFLATMDLSPDGKGWSITGTVKEQRRGSVETYGMDWQPDSTVHISRTLENFSEFRYPFFTLADPLVGPYRWRTMLTTEPPVPVSQATNGEAPQELASTPSVTTLPQPQPGLVHIHVDPDMNHWSDGNASPLPSLLLPGQSLAQLFPTDTTVPGTYNNIQETLLYQMNREKAVQPTYDGGGTEACNYNLEQCNYNQTTQLLVPMHNKSITAVLPVADTTSTPNALTLYRQLLPTGYQVPRHPAVGIYLTTIDIPLQAGEPLDSTSRTAWDGSHYIEGSISLRTIHDGEVGWYHLAMPENSSWAQSSGYAEGYPKYLADMTFGQTPSGGWSSTAAVNGTKTLAADWEPQRIAPNLLQLDFAKFADPFFTLSKPLKGPDQWRTKLTVIPPVPQYGASDNLSPTTPGCYAPINCLASPQWGTVHLRINPDFSVDSANTTPRLPNTLGTHLLSELVNTDQTVTGSYDDTNGTLLYQMDEKGHEPLPSPSSFPAPPAP